MANSRPNLDLHLRNNADTDCFDHNYSDLFSTSYYVDACKRNLFDKKNHDDLFIIHFNVRSIQKNIDSLNNLLSSFKNQPDIVAISKTKLKKEKINRNFNLDGYTFIHSDSTTNAGSVGLYIKNKIKFELNQYSNYLLPNSEHLWIDIHAKTGPIVVGVVYRHPIATVSAEDNFKDSLNEILTVYP